MTTPLGQQLGNRFFNSCVPHPFPATKNTGVASTRYVGGRGLIPHPWFVFIYTKEKGGTDVSHIIGSSAAMVEKIESITQHRILAQQVRLLYRQAPAGLIFTIAVPPVLSLLLLSEVPILVLAGWCLATACVVAVRYLILRRFGESDSPDQQIRHWSRLFTLGASASGLVWGVGAAVLLSHTSLLNQFVVLLVITAVIAAAMPYLSASPITYRFFSIGSAAPVIIWCFTQSDWTYSTLGILGIVYLWAILTAAHKFSNTLIHSFKLQSQKSDLANDLIATNERLREDIKEREKVERDLKYRADLQRIVTGLSSKFVAVPVDAIDSCINQGLAEIGKFADVDRSYLFLYDDAARTFDNTHEWCRRGVSPQIDNLQNIPVDELPFIFNKLCNGEDIHIPKVSELPLEAETERRHLEQQDIKSLAVVPLTVGGVFKGFLGFDSVRSEKTWSDDIIMLLRVAGETFINALERKRADGLIWEQANYDALTSLPNRRLLVEMLSVVIAACSDRGSYGAVLFLDLDHFKTINDSLGHTIGNAVLVEVADRIKAGISEHDLLGRVGADEFIVILSLAADSEPELRPRVRKVAEKLKSLVATPYHIEGHKLHVTASVGVAFFPCGTEDAETVLVNADTAMYQAKDAGRNSVNFFKPRLQKVAKERLRLHNSLSHALISEQLELYYQPQANADGNWFGAEALVRWRQEDDSIVPASSFIKIVEETGLIIDIDSWVIQEVIKSLPQFNSESLGVNFEKVSANVSPKTFLREDLVTLVRDHLYYANGSGTLLELEFTENVLLSAHRETIVKMKALRDIGVSLAIDDFGTGYSSLSYLKALPIDRIKIDRFFVSGVNTHQANAAIVEAVVSVAKKFNVDIIAEGVETEEQLESLRNLGVEQFQGYYFSAPLSMSDLRSGAPARQRQQNDRKLRK